MMPRSHLALSHFARGVTIVFFAVIIATYTFVTRAAAGTRYVRLPPPAGHRCHSKTRAYQTHLGQLQTRPPASGLPPFELNSPRCLVPTRFANGEHAMAISCPY